MRLALLSADFLAPISRGYIRLSTERQLIAYINRYSALPPTVSGIG
jgi:hypothetical protein